LKSEVCALKNVSLGDVLDIRDGTHDTPKYVEIGIPLITSKNLTDYGLCFRDISFISEADHNQILNRSAVENGDILYGMIGTIGKPTLVETDRKFSIKNVALFKQSNPQIHNKYLRRLLNSPPINSQIAQASKGGTQKFVSLGALRGLKATFPSFKEQRRIAAILDQADALRAKRGEALVQLDSLMQSIFIEMFGDVLRNPKFARGMIRPFVDANSGKSAKYILSTDKTDIPVYGGNGINGWATNSLYDSPVLVFGRVGQQCGNAFITEGPSWVTDNAIVIRITDTTKLIAIYVLHAFQGSDFSRRVKHLDLPFINQSMILDNLIPIPPLILQKTFATRIQTVEALKSTHIASLEKLDSLFSSLQHRAFRGEL
jgi:type I restriction enzyme S subunit